MMPTDADRYTVRLQRAARVVNSSLRVAASVYALQREGAHSYDHADCIARELLCDAFGLPTDDPLVVEGADGWLVEINIDRIRVRVVQKGSSEDGEQ